MNKTLSILSACLVFAASAYCQTRAITEKGDSIIVYDNGTWEPLNKETSPLIAEFGSVTTSIQIDEKTKIKTLNTEYWSYIGLDSKGKTISGSMYKVNGMYLISLTFSGDLGCLPKDKGSLRIKLSNGYIIECFQLSKTDCGRLARAEFMPISLEQSKLPDYRAIMLNNIQLMATYDWEMMRLQGSKFYSDLLPNSYKQLKHPEQFFRQHLSALIR